jgi:hypothetical protein
MFAFAAVHRSHVEYWSACCVSRDVFTHLTLVSTSSVLCMSLLPC